MLCKVLTGSQRLKLRHLLKVADSKPDKLSYKSFNPKLFKIEQFFYNFITFLNYNLVVILHL